TGEPDVVVLVDENAVLGLRPVVTFARTAPGAVKLAVLIELEHRRGRCAALGGWRVLHRAFFIVDQGRWPLDNPDVVVPVDRDVRHLAEDLVAGQGLGPEGVDLKERHVVAVRRREREENRADKSEHGRLDDVHYFLRTRDQVSGIRYQQ